MRFTIGNKLALCIGILLCLFLISVVLSFLQTQAISREITNTFNETVHAINKDLAASHGSILKKIDKLNINAGILLILGLLSGVLSIIFLTRNISAPISRLINATKDLTYWREYKPVIIQTNDEFEILASSFNDMAVELQRAKTELQIAHHHQEMKVEERTKDLKESYQALAKLEQRFSQLLNLSPSAIYATTLEQPHRCKFISRAFMDLTGYEPEEMIGDANFWLEHIHPDDRLETVNSINRTLSIPTVTGTGASTYRFKHRSGEYRWIHDTFRIINNEEGQPHEMVGAWTDVTHEKMAIHVMQASQERFRVAAESSNDLIYERDLDTGTLLWYGDVDGVLNYAPNEFPRTITAWEDSIHPDDRAALKAAIENHLANPAVPFDQQYRILAKDGKYKIWRDRGKLILRDNRPTGRWIGTCTDITKTKRMEQQFLQAQKMESVGLLAGGIAHDFNNLLTAIIGFSDMVLQSDELSATGREYINEVKNAGMRAADLTRQLLAFSRKQVIAPVILDLNGIVSQMDKMLRRLLGENIQLTHKLEPALNPINADASQMEQIVMNLAVNARDAMPTGGQIVIETKNVELDKYYALNRPEVIPGHYVMLAISDTGTGISPADQARIFEPFFTTKEKGKGTGLGLATVYGIVKQSGGYIYLYSEPGMGTIFRVYMPVAEPAEKPAGETASASHYLSKNNETILLVEDEPSVRTVARTILKNYGYKILEASSGNEALRICEQHPGPIHLLLTDVLMPEMNGQELSSRISSRYPEVRVLFMSGYTDDAISRHGILEEGTAFLTKPFTAESLARKIHEVLHQQ